MNKKTIRADVLDDFKMSLVFKDNDGDKSIKVVLPAIVKGKWAFGSEKEEAAFAGYAAAIGNEFIHFGLTEEEVSAKLKVLTLRTITAGLLRRK